MTYGVEFWFYAVSAIAWVFNGVMWGLGYWKPGRLFCCVMAALFVLLQIDYALKACCEPERVDTINNKEESGK